MADQRDDGYGSAPGSLFSTDAADNAEVVHDDAPRGPDAMWSTSAKAVDVDPIDVEPLADEPIDEPATPDAHRPPPPPPGWERSVPSWSAAAAEDDAWERMAGAPSGRTGGEGAAFRAAEPGETVWASPQPTGVGGVFSAEPVERGGDVVDEADVDDVIPNADGRGVFASGPSSSSSTAPQDPWSAWEPAAATDRPAGPPPFGRPGDVFRAPAAETRPDGDPTDLVAADAHGYAEAVSRLRAEDQQRVRVPLSVCGALLEPGERVVGVVTGQMLGRPAAVVATHRRVLVVNDRRWQPIVDVYAIGEDLQVRGRHDGHVAALSFADDGHLSMVDGITEVDLAVALAASIRDPDAPDPSEGTEF